MGKGFDCATSLTLEKAKLFKSQGYGFVCRYLAALGSWKRLSKEEAIRITDAGLWIVSVFQKGTGEALRGAAQGTIDGRLALQYARDVGQPVGSTIYAAVDMDTNPTQFAAIEAYFRAFAKEIVGYEVGIYGEYEVCKAMQDRKAVVKVWQTYAWSKGIKLPNPNLYQYKNDISVNGMNIDLDESNGDAGGWRYGFPTVQPKPPVIEQPKPSVPPVVVQPEAPKSSLDIVYANSIINTYLSPQWSHYNALMNKESNAANKTEWKRLRDYQNELANALRRASGQKEE